MTKNAGLEGFVWFFGRVENRLDPLLLGRVQIRIFNFHTSDISILPTTSLPWASIGQPIYSAAQNGVGISPTGIQVGSIVYGWFLDGEEAQLPIIMGTIAGLHAAIVLGDGPQGFSPKATSDINPLVQGIDTFVNVPIGPEPQSAYSAIYPFNKVFTSEGGISVEYDDTPLNRRIRVIHPSGTYTEINETGRVVTKAVDNTFEIDLRNRNVYIQGQLTVQVLGDSIFNVNGDASINVVKNATISVLQNAIASVGQNLTAEVQGVANITASKLNIEATSDITVVAGGTFSVHASTIDFISGSRISLTGVAIVVTAGVGFIVNSIGDNHINAGGENFMVPLPV